MASCRLHNGTFVTNGYRVKYSNTFQNVEEDSFYRTPRVFPLIFSRNSSILPAANGTLTGPATHPGI